MTSIKDAIKKFEEKFTTPEQPVVAAEAEKVILYGQMPPIAKMDNTLSTLKACKHLALSSNTIEKITGIKGCERLPANQPADKLPSEKLEILSLGRNQIKKLDGVEDVAETLQELWISYNLLSSLKGVEKLTRLRVLYCAQNLIAKWAEVEVLRDCKALEELILTGNPLWEEANKTGDFREQIAFRMPWLKKLDGSPVTDEERTAGQEKFGS